MNVQLVHPHMAVRFYRSLGCAKLKSHLLVQLASDHQCKDLGGGGRTQRDRRGDWCRRLYRRRNSQKIRRALARVNVATRDLNEPR